MRRTESVKLDDERSCTVKEMTVAEIDGWLKDAEERSADAESANPVDLLLFDDQFHIWDLARMSDLSDLALRQLTPSELEAVAEVAKRLNPHFFRLWTRLYQHSPG